jgi:pilus assembly protein CpaF
VLRRRDHAGEVVVVPAWTRGDGWALGRADLAAMLRERGVEPPWDGPPAPPAGAGRPAGVAAVAAGVSVLRREPA